jgi:hypothetical protein
MDWRSFLKTLVGTAFGLAVFVYVVVLVVDPYDTVFFSPPLPRAPTATNQRFAYPALARKEKFDSAVIGTSTARLFRPEELDAAFGGRFVNLAMNSGTAWEQAQILDLFARHHPDAKTVLIGLDVVWCFNGPDYPKLTPRPFPAWMYDENRWNDLVHLFNYPTLEEVGRQFAHMTGIWPSEYGLDGYTNFLPPPDKYDLSRARENIYGSSEPKPSPTYDPEEISLLIRGTDWRFSTHPLLAEKLRALPAATRKILLFVPYHLYWQRKQGSLSFAQYEGCKQQVAALAASIPNAQVLDFMIESDITREDRNYWDPLHFSTEIASRVTRLVADAVRTGTSSPYHVRIVAPGG